MQVSKEPKDYQSKSRIERRDPPLAPRLFLYGVLGFAGVLVLAVLLDWAAGS